MEVGMNAKLVIRRRISEQSNGDIDSWWVEDEAGHQWEIFSYDFQKFFVQYDNGESCGTGEFVLAPGQELSTGSEFPGTLTETPVGKFGVPCELEF
jgi:hypothetical protein